MRPTLRALIPWIAGSLAACAPAAGSQRDTAPSRATSSRPIEPLVAPTGLDPATVALGRTLFHDPRLSGDGTVSCSSCHDLARGGADGRATSIGIGGARGDVNAPTVFNSSLNLRQFWDGRAATLEEQIDGPVQAPGEMGATWPDVVARISADRRMTSSFEDIYADGVTASNIRDAIATFERSLVATDSPFDRWITGEADAIGADEQHGYDLFLSYGCVSCHQGANVGGNMFQTFGILDDWFADRGTAQTAADQGRFNVTGREEDRHVFRVPSLRFVVRTAPYFHDGSAATLDEAIRVMGEFQLGREIPAADRESIAAFFETLPGTVGGHHAP